MMRRRHLAALGLGVGAGAMSTWFHISHGVVCVPLLAVPPLNLTPNIAAGSTAAGVGVRQGLALGLQASSAGVDGRPPIEQLVDVNAAFVCGIASAVTAWKSASWTKFAPPSTLFRCSGLALMAASAIIPWRNAVRDGGIEPFTHRPAYELPTRFDPTQIPTSRLAELVFLGVVSGVFLGTTGIGTAWALAPALVQLGYVTGVTTSVTDESSTTTIESSSGGAERTINKAALERFEHAQSTAMASTMPATIAAAARHYMLGHLSPLAWPLMGGALFGGYLGAEMRRSWSTGMMPEVEQANFMRFSDPPLPKAGMWLR